MDILQRINLPFITKADLLMTTQRQFEDSVNVLQEQILTNGEIVLILKIKQISLLTSEELLTLKALKENKIQSFLTLKYILLKEQEQYLCFESEKCTLLQYMRERSLANLTNPFDIKERFLLFSKACEIIYLLLKKKESFSFFNHNLFFVSQNKENSFKLKFMCHGKN